MNYIKESSLSRILRHNEAHDCGAMTAFRVAKDCGEGEPYNKADNKKRNKSLKAKLLSKGYSVTAVKGEYPEGGKTVREDSFFVVDIKDTGQLERDLIKLGEMFEQDSILFMPKGSVTGETQAYLIGTNNCKNNWLGMGHKEYFKKGRFGIESPIYSTKINGRPFIFEDKCEAVVPPGNGMGWWALRLVAESEWEKVDIDTIEELIEKYI